MVSDESTGSPAVDAWMAEENRRRRARRIAESRRQQALERVAEAARAWAAAKLAMTAGNDDGFYRRCDAYMDACGALHEAVEAWEASNDES